MRISVTVCEDSLGGFRSSYFQLLADQPVDVRPGKKVSVDIRLDGTTHVRFKGYELKFKTIEKPSRKSQGAFNPEEWVRKPVRRHRPAVDHPWRRGYKRLITPMRAHLATA